MILKELLELVAKGEGASMEVHAATGHEAILQDVCAFVNCDGGKVVVLANDGDRLLSSEQAHLVADQLRSDLSERITPLAVCGVQVIDGNAGAAILIDVPEGLDKPYVIGGSILLRESATSRAATSEEIRRMVLQRSIAGQRWERQIVPGINADALDTGLLSTVMIRAKEQSQWSGGQVDFAGFFGFQGTSVGKRYDQRFRSSLRKRPHQVHAPSTSKDHGVRWGQIGQCDEQPDHRRALAAGH